MKKTSTRDFIQKKGAEKIAVLTAYDAIFARLADDAGVDAILVGDSVGNTFMGHASTIPVRLEDMFHHVAMAARAKPKAMLIADLPFAVCHYSFDRLLDACAEFIRLGADAVKIEGGASLAEKLSRLANAGIPVMAHIGLMPQQLMKTGGYRTFAKTPEERRALVADAKTLERAGAFSIVIEKADPLAAKEATESVSIPTIGIGSGPHCDGQVLVSTDVLGLGDWIPAFAKKYADLRGESMRAFSGFVSEVKSGKFPE